MTFIQDAMGWTEVDSNGKVIGHLSHEQYANLLNDTLNNHAHTWFVHYGQFFDHALQWLENQDMLGGDKALLAASHDWVYLLHSIVGGLTQ